jgi:ATP-dependent Clp protease ATP-binding subunit ClpC
VTSQQPSNASPLTAGAQKLIEAAAARQKEAGHQQAGVHHWLVALLERHGPMAAALVPGLDAAGLRQQLWSKLQQGDVGAPLSAEHVTSEALERAHERGKDKAGERDVAVVILMVAGHAVVEPAWTGPQSAQAQTAPAAQASGWQPTARGPTPALDFFGRDLTRLAAEGKLSPMVGRAAELTLTIETLCRRSKRNPVLVGPAGVGKTAVVEGLAMKVVRGEVPEPLRGVRIVVLQPSAIVAGSGAQGELETRIRNLLTEASQPGIILFIDEIHSLIGAGGMPGTTDLASQVKPALARGDLACIAATTDEEYRRFIEADNALERRFQPVRIEELTAEQTVEVLAALRAELARLRKVEVPDEVLRLLVHFAEQYVRNRHFPDKAVDLLEQCVAHAVARGKAVVEPGDAEEVAQRTAGMPVALTERLPELGRALQERGLMPAADVEALVNRLQVTLRGLDLRPVRPNAVVLLTGKAAAGALPLGEAIAAGLFGDARRVVSIDFGRFAHPADIALLVGAPPGYVGYSDALPMHRVAHLHWCVLVGANVHACHPQVLEVFTQALASGYLTESRGRRIYLSDAVVLLTAAPELQGAQPFGFGAAPEAATASARSAAEAALGPELVGQCQVIVTAVAEAVPDRRRWFADHMAPQLAARYARHGVELSWHDSLIDWLVSQAGPASGPADWERLIDDHLGPVLARNVSVAQQRRSLLVRHDGSRVCVEPVDAPERKA